MPSSYKTKDGLNDWIGTDKPKRDDFNSDNYKIQEKFDYFEDLSVEIRGKIVGRFGEGENAEIFNAYPGKAYENKARGDYSHAEGSSNYADGEASHAQGKGNNACGEASHAEGLNTYASGVASHAQGVATSAEGYASHAGGYSTIADSDYQTAIGKYNEENDNAALSIGNGYAYDTGEIDDEGYPQYDLKRKTIFKVDWDGNAYTQLERLIRESELTGAKKELYERISQLIGDAPETLDTLEEIAEWIAEHEDLYSDTVAAIHRNTEDIAENTSRIQNNTDAIATLNTWKHEHSAEYSELHGQVQAHEGRIEYLEEHGGGELESDRYVPKDWLGAPSTFQYKDLLYSVLADPDELPRESVWGVCFSPDQQYLAVCLSQAPYMMIYKRDEETFTRLAGPDVLPTGFSRGITFSPDGQYLVVAYSSAPYVSIYKNSDGNFTKLEDPDLLPADSGQAACFSPDGQYLAIGHRFSPFIAIYHHDNGIFTKCQDPDVLPESSGYAVAFSPDGRYLAVGSYSAPFLTVYQAENGAFSQLPDADVLPASQVNDIAFSPDGRYMAIAQGDAPYVNLYQMENSILTKLDDPDVLPTGTAYGLSFTADGSYLAVAGDGTHPAVLYRNQNGVLTKFETLSLPLDAGATGVHFSVDDTYLAVGMRLAPYLRMFRYVPESVSVLSPPAETPPGEVFSVAFSENDSYMAAVHTTSPYLTVYQQQNGKYVRLPGPADPPSDAQIVTMSADGSYIGAAKWHGSLWVYRNHEGLLTSLEIPDIPSGIYSIALSADGNYLAVTSINAPYLTLYSNTEGVFTKLDHGLQLTSYAGAVVFSGDSSLFIVTGAFGVLVCRNTSGSLEIIDQPTQNSVMGVSLSADSTYLAIGFLSSPYVALYKNIDGTFVRHADPDIPPEFSLSTEGIALSPDGQYLVLTHPETPWVSLYKNQNGTLTRLDSSAVTTSSSFIPAFTSAGKVFAVGHFRHPYLSFYEIGHWVLSGEYATIGVATLNEAGTLNENQIPESLNDRIRNLEEHGGGGSSDLSMDPIQIGKNAVAGASTETAIGLGANTSGEQTIALGTGATASSMGSVAMGYNTNASGGALATGYNAKANGMYAVAYGISANASFTSASAIGSHSSASAYHSQAWCGGKASGQHSIAVGLDAEASEEGSISIGAYSQSIGRYTTVIGNGAAAQESYSVAINGFAGKTHTVAINASALLPYATALGFNAVAGHYHALALGSSATANGDGSTAIGTYANVAVSESHTMQLGSHSLSVLRSAVPLTVTSDERDKTDITDIYNSLDFINQISPIHYVNNERQSYFNWEKLSEKDKENYKKFSMSEYDRDAHAAGEKRGWRQRVGVSAQQVQAALEGVYGTADYADLVNDNLYDARQRGEEIPEGVESLLTVNYSGFIPFLISGMQELTKRNEQQQALIDQLLIEMKQLKELLQ